MRFPSSLRRMRRSVSLSLSYKSQMTTEETSASQGLHVFVSDPEPSPFGCVGPYLVYRVVGLTLAVWGLTMPNFG